MEGEGIEKEHKSKEIIELYIEEISDTKTYRLHPNSHPQCFRNTIYYYFHLQLYLHASACTYIIRRKLIREENDLTALSFL